MTTDQPYGIVVADAGLFYGYGWLKYVHAILLNYHTGEMMLHTLPAHHPALRRLFSPALPNAAMLFATLDGHYPGVALVDDPHTPAHAVVRTHYGTTFYSTHCSDNILARAIVTLRQHGAIRVVVPRADMHHRHLPSGMSRRIGRCEFRSHNPVTLQELGPPPSAHALQMVVLDRAALVRSHGYREVLAASGNVDTFLKHGCALGVVTPVGLVAEAATLFTGAGVLELSVVTHPDHRGQGYATWAVAALLHQCATREQRTYWSCHADNVASQRLARRVGYTNEQEYAWVRYEHTNPESACDSQQRT